MQNTLEKKTKKLQKLLEVNRIRILQLLYKEDTCVCKMVKDLNLKHNLVSHHLKVLTETGFIESSRNGVHIIYSLKDTYRKKVKELLDLLN